MDMRRGFWKVLRQSAVAISLILLLGATMAQSQPPLADPSEFGYKNMATGGLRPLLVVLLENPNEPFPKFGQSYEKMVFGPLAGQPSSLRSVFGYFAENGNGNFMFGRGGIVGPIPYTMKDGQQMRLDSIKLAADQGHVQFSTFDSNHDGTVSQNELSVLVMYSKPCAQSGVHELDVQGLHLQIGISIVGPGTEPGWSEHELSHTLGAKDLYGEWAGGPKLHLKLSIMGPTFDQGNLFHIDAWHKMQFGWQRPRVFDMRVPGSETLVAQQVRQSDTPFDKGPILLYDPAKGTKEFFLLEFRNPGVASSSGNYEANVPSAGLALWHVRQDDHHMPVYIPSDSNAKVQIPAVFTRDPLGVQGGNQLHTNGWYFLRWVDGSQTGIAVKVGTVAANDKTMKVSWEARDPLSLFGGPGLKHTMGEVVARQLGVSPLTGALWVLGYRKTDGQGGRQPDPARVDRPTGGYAIYKWGEEGYQEVDGKAVRIAVDNDGVPWVINDQHTVFKREMGNWKPLPGLATDIAHGGDGSVWIIGLNENAGGFVGRGGTTTEAGIHKWNGTGWDQIDGAAVSIAVDQKGNPWVINGNGSIFRRQGNAWVVLPGTGKDIAIGGGEVYIVGTNPVQGGFGIYRWSEATGKFTDVELAHSGGGTSVAVNAKGEVFVTTSDGAINYTAPRIR